jgi:3-hydroxymyristoyl/3-hydroxydecanoyl-(acyl carrier protein) dehydratase
MNNTELELIVPPAHPCFADHFAGNPIVPGALLLQWLCQQLQLHYPGQRVSTIMSLKFLKTLGPGDRCRLVLTAGAKTGQLKLQVLRGGSTVCQGVLKLHDEPSS